MTTPIEILKTVLAPQGIKTVTTGGDEIGRFLEQRYGSTDPGAVREAWEADLERISTARVVMLGVPMDAGAGFERGSFKGPLGIRTALLAAGVYDAFAAAGVVDIGDVRVNPHMVDDTYYTPQLLDAVRAARGRDDALPVSPHSAFRAALEAISELNPDARVLHLGGDHSTSRIPAEWLTAEGSNTARDLGILHFDAHTDLLSERDGVPHNFATWAYHANEAIGRGRRLVQLGIRVSGRSRSFWEDELDLRQIRMDEIDSRPVDEIVDEVVDIYRLAGVTRLYMSNDIDGTDPRWAASTGTMEPGGMTPEFVSEMIRRIGAEFPIVAADVVEVAPPLKWHVPGEPARTIATACRYVIDTLEVMLSTEERLSSAFDDVVPATMDEVLSAPGFVSND